MPRETVELSSLGCVKEDLNIIKSFVIYDCLLKQRIQVEICLRKATMYEQVFLYAFHFPLEDTVEDFLLL